MMNLVTTSTVLVLYLPALAVTEKKPHGNSAICGEWRMIGSEEKGKYVAGNAVKKENHYGVSIANDTITFHSHETSKLTLSYTINTAKSPAHLNLIYGKTKTNHAIIWQWKTLLIICVSNKFRPNKPQDRPSAFSTEDNKPQHRGIVVTFYCKTKQLKKE